MKVWQRWALPVLITIVLAGCGTTTHSVTILQAATPQQQAIVKASKGSAVTASTRIQDSVSCPPPPGEGVMGACTPKPVQVNGTSITPLDPPGPASIPDVSSYQRVVNWAAVKSWQVAHNYTPAGIFKLGEYIADPYAARNNAVLRNLHMWRAGYWFLRKTGCSHEAAQIIAEAHALGLRVVFLDDEVPEARGYDGCITPTLRRAALIVGEYGAPGTYPGGSRTRNPAWVASYGPSSPPLAPWGGAIVAFQCTDGIFGCVTFVPGLGRIDMSVNLGVTKLGVAITRVRLVCFGRHAHVRNATCRKVRARVAKWQRAAKSTRKSLASVNALDRKLSQRARWFNDHAQTLTRRYS